MHLASKRVVQRILAKHTIGPRKTLGQNFLVDRNVVKRLVSAAAISPQDTVLEVGPGIGTLTQELAQRAKQVIAVEKDKRMIEILRDTPAEFKNVEIIHGDVLKVKFQSSNPEKNLLLHSSILLPQKYKIVANLPYSITAPVIRKFLELCEARPSTMTLMVQKEVAQRICTKPPHMNMLAVSVQIYATAKIISYIKKAAFWPQPKVDAAILHLTPLPQPYPIDFLKFFTVVKAGFKQPRKQLVNNLSSGLALSRQKTEQWLLQNNIQPTQRAETLSIQDWIHLTNNVLISL